MIPMHYSDRQHPRAHTQSGQTDVLMLETQEKARKKEGNGTFAWQKIHAL